MTKRNKILIMLAMNLMGFIASIGLIHVSEEAGWLTWGWILLGINAVGLVANTINLENAPDERELTVDLLRSLKCVGEEKDGSFSDWWEVSIVPVPEKERWSFCHFNEIDDSRTHIKYVKTMQELKDAYKLLMDEELE